MRMAKRARWHATAVLTVFVLVASSPLTVHAQAGDDWTAEQREILALIRSTAEANNASDVEAWVALFADDFVYMPPGVPPVTTRSGLVEIAEAGFRHDADIEIEPLEITVTGGWAFARNRVSGTVTVNPSGEVISVDSNQIVIYRRSTSGDWRIARLISNSSS